MSLIETLEQLQLQHQQQAHEHTGNGATIEHDADWPSPCEKGTVDELGNISWQAVKQPSKSTLMQLASALDCEFPAQLDALYSSYYSANLPLEFQGHSILLLQAWNEQDFENLQQNITGHVLMKRRLKHNDTVFFALTENEDMLLVVNLSDGSVWLEQVGKKPHQKVADDLASFLSQCEAKH